MFIGALRSNVPAVSAVLATVLAGFPAMPSAHAETVLSKLQQNAAGACQDALPAFAGTLRARPLALQNEGESLAFATCFPAYNDNASSEEGASAVNLRLVNNTASPVEVSCTLVDGALTFSVTPVYLPATTTVPAGVTASVSWVPADYQDPQPDSILRPNVSCALPPGVGIASINYFYQRQIGE